MEEDEFRHQLSREAEELPRSCGRTRIVLLPVNPFVAYVYWEIGPDIPGGAGARPEGEGQRADAVLRFREGLATDVGDPRARSFLDVPIRFQACGSGSTYVRLSSPGVMCRVELALKTGGEEGYTLVTESSLVSFPCAEPLPPPTVPCIEPPDAPGGGHVESVHSASRERLAALGQTADLCRAAVEGPETGEGVWIEGSDDACIRGIEGSSGPSPLPEPARDAPVPADEKVDLTAMSERRFVRGISSTPSSPASAAPGRPAASTGPPNEG